MMKFILAILISVLTVNFVFASNANDVLKFKSKIGFTKEEDKILAYRFIDNETKILLMGERNLQVWDVENAKLLYSVEHQIPQFAPDGFVSTYLLLGLPKLLNWRPFLVDENGEWLITAEKIGQNKLRSAVIRELPSLKQIAVLKIPDVSVEYISYYAPKNEILTFGITNKKAAFASWDYEKFTKKELVFVDEYKWHQTIRDDNKILVGSGDTKILWSGLNIKQGDTLTLRDAKTGSVEKEYTAKNLRPETAYQETTVSTDEKYLISKRNDRVFVWEIDGDGQPKFEISNPNPKGKFYFEKIIDRRFIVVEIDTQVRVYDIFGDGKPMLEVSPQNAKEKVSFVSLVGERYAVIKADNKIRIYDTNGEQILKFEIASSNPKDTMEYWGASLDGKYLAVKDDQLAAVYEFSGNGTPLYEIKRESEKERFRTIKFIEDKNLLAVARVNNAEKKSPRTEFYEVSSGKISFEVPYAISYQLKVTPDEKYFYESGIGWFSVWNKSTGKLTAVNLKTHTQSNYDPNSSDFADSEKYNVEHAEFSPDFRYILRYGNDITAVFDTESGQEVQKLFDAERAKYDKNKNLKKSGLGDAGWTKNGKYVYTFNEGGLFGKRRTISFWEVVK